MTLTESDKKLYDYYNSSYEEYVKNLNLSQYASYYFGTTLYQKKNPKITTREYINLKRAKII